MSTAMIWKPIFNQTSVFRSRTVNGPSLPLNHSFLRLESITRKGFSIHTPLRSHHVIIKASLVDTPASLDSSQISELLYKETFPLNWTKKVKGKFSVKLDRVDGGDDWQLSVSCNVRGEWVLHWGVSYCDEDGSEWDQPPVKMWPSGSVPIKDYAIETPLKRISLPEGQMLNEVKLKFSSGSSIATIHFVLKDMETGCWYQYRGRNFSVPLMDNYLEEGETSVDGTENFDIRPGIGKISRVVSKVKASGDRTAEDVNNKRQSMNDDGLCKEYLILKEEPTQSLLIVSVQRDFNTDRRHIFLDTDLPGDVILHWGICRDSNKIWEIPESPLPPQTNVFRNKALRTLLKKKDHGEGSFGQFSLDKDPLGFVFALKLDSCTWVNNMSDDFFIPLVEENSFSLSTHFVRSQVESQPMRETEKVTNDIAYTDDIINDIRSLVSDISAEKTGTMKSKEAQESILQEIEKLAAEAYSIFRNSVPTFVEPISDSGMLETPIKICSGAGTGYEIMCQGFNWESNKSGRWYSELYDKVPELASLGFTVVWLPPPTESVSPQGYMPKDLYNLNSRYGTTDELKRLVKRFHEFGIKVLGDVVLNHRCAQYQNQNGIWNIFGGRLNWDDRAVVSDDPHFQGRGNRSTGESFHAAPNIDHSQDFVRKDIKEWLCWLRKEIGFDGWRLDFVRGFWGGYFKDYMEASEPYFAVGEYWDSLSYTYDKIDHNQDAHRQRIIDWINATNGTSSAFDISTKGIFHAALDRCEYWRLSDPKGKPPGVIGWWPSRAVTFIENHDTGSTQGHWRFPAGKEMQGYAYILTHSGTPSVFYDHIFSHYQQEIANLIAIRLRTKIHCRSSIQIKKAVADVYAACIDEKVMMKIGPGYFELPDGSKNWVLAAEGNDYKVWEAL